MTGPRLTEREEDMVTAWMAVIKAQDKLNAAIHKRNTIMSAIESNLPPAAARALLEQTHDEAARRLTLPKAERRATAPQLDLLEDA